jgi:hypothetical protein
LKVKIKKKNKNNRWIGKPSGIIIDGKNIDISFQILIINFTLVD